jgi:hypothetical protein
MSFLYLIFYIFIKLMFILDPLNVSKWRWQQQRFKTQQGMEMGLGIKGGVAAAAAAAAGARDSMSRVDGMFFILFTLHKNMSHMPS